MINPDLPTLLDILLSLTFIFFLVSMFVSGIWEFISSILRDKRATLLRNSLKHLLADAAFADLIYEHPLIRGLVVRRPSKPLEKIFRGMLNRESNPAKTELIFRPAYIAPELFSRVLLSLVQQYAPSAEANAHKTPLTNQLSPLRQWVNTMSDSSLPVNDTAKAELQAILVALMQDVSDTNGGVGQVLTGIESWYNAYMDRVSGYFKQYSQEGIRWVAIVVVVAFNLDALHLTTELYRDPVFRALTVRQATHAVESIGNKLDTTIAGQVVAKAALQKRFNLDSVAVAKLAKPADTLKKLASQRDLMLALIDQKSQTRLDSLKQQQSTLTGEMLGLQQLPVGWSTFCKDLEKLDVWHKVFFVLKMLLGWTLMVAAVSFGAPFWFDILIKLVNIRNVGKKPADKPAAKN